MPDVGPLRTLSGHCRANWWWAVLCLLLLNGCAAEAAPDLLDVREVGPSALEPGGRLEIGGAGFPERQRGRVFLSGNVFAPAERTRTIELSWPVESESRSRALVRLTEKQLSALNEGAPHVTFRGRVSLEFESVRAGGPVLRGDSEDVVLDFFQRQSSVGVTEGPSFADYLGLELSEGLVVASVRADSEGAQAGLVPGDRLLALDGVRLESQRDFLPANGLDVSSLEFRRAGHRATGTAVLDRAGYQPLSGRSAVDALVMLVAALVGLVFAARPPQSIAWLFRSRKSGVTARENLEPAARPSVAEHVCFLTVACALWWALGGTQGDLSGPLGLLGAFDLELFSCLGCSCLILSAFLVGGRLSGRRSFSVSRALSSAGAAGLLLVPALVAAALRATETGSLRLADLSRAQGPEAMSFALLESPWSLLLGLAFLGCLVPRVGFRSALETRRLAQPAERSGALIGFLGQVMLVGLWVVAFLGGTAGFAAHGVAGGLWLCLKMALVLAVLRFASARLSHLRALESLGFFGPVVFGCALVGSVAFAVSVASSVVDSHFELLRHGVWTLLVLGLLGLGLSVSRALGHSGRTADPWI